MSEGSAKVWSRVMPQVHCSAWSLMGGGGGSARAKEDTLLRRRIAMSAFGSVPREAHALL